MQTLRTEILKITLLLIAALIAAQSDTLAVSKPKLKSEPQKDTLAEYIARVKSTPLANPSSGSLWSADSPFADLASDYKAKRVNDVIIINIVEQTSSSNNGAVKSARTLNGSSSITGLFGLVGPNNAMQNIFSPNSSNALNGQAQASSSSTLQTTIAGSIVATLPNGLLVIEAQRKESVDNEVQTLTMRGVVRPGDVATDGSVNSTSISNLEILLNGRGVISDGVRPPNKVINTILKLLEF